MFSCPNCSSISTKVYNTRLASNGVKRSRKCSSCGNAFYTLETAQVSNDGKVDISKLKSDIIELFDNFISEK